MAGGPAAGLEGIGIRGENLGSTGNRAGIIPGSPLFPGCGCRAPPP